MHFLQIDANMSKSEFGFEAVSLVVQLVCLYLVQGLDNENKKENIL